MAVTNIRGVFGLSDYRKRQLSGLVPEKIRPVFREYGYFGGGGGNGGSGPLSLVDRIDYSNDTTLPSIRGPLASAIYAGAAAGNSNFGYYVGGIFPVNNLSCKVNRIDYSNDTVDASLRSSLTIGRSGIGGSGNSNFGYFAGGRYIASPDTNTSLVDRINYSNDNITPTFRGPLAFAGRMNGGTSNSDYGWYSGKTTELGFTATSRVERTDFSNDNNIALVRGDISPTIIFRGATGNSNFGYFAGGLGNNSEIHRIEYSNDTALSLPRALLSLARDLSAGTGNSNFGYFGGGYTQSSIPRTTVDRIDYSNDTVTATARAPLSGAKGRALAATSSASFGGTPNSLFASNYKFPTVPNAGYFSGGRDSNDIEIFTIQKIDYSNDTASTSPRSGLPIDHGAVSSSATSNSNFGYIAGGGPGGPVYSVIRRLDYSNDNAPTSLRGNLSVARNTRHSAAGNSNFGYFYGGNSGGSGFSTLDRIDYSNDLLDVPTRANLTDREIAGGTGNSNFGYFGGGVDPSNNTLSIIERIDYSNDTLIPPVSFLGLPVRNVAATGNQSFGYFGAGRKSPGNIDISDIQRLDYSNDTQNSLLRGNLTFSEQRHAATGNNSFGYFSGGGAGGVINSQVCRLNYANDTAIAPARGSFPSGRVYHAGLSPLEYGGAPIYFTNQLPQVLQDQITFDDSNTLELPYKRALGSFGYFAGGNIGPEIQRLDYSNDLANTLTRSNLSATANSGAAAGNSNFGYYVHPQGSPIKSAIDRIDYSNDSARTLLRGSVISTGSLRLSGSGNLNFGYFAGDLTNVERFDYSNDNANSVFRGNLSSVTFDSSSTGTLNFGYHGGGLYPTAISTVQRISYANDLSKSLIRGPLTLPRWRFASTGNNNFGYFGGGRYLDVARSTVDRINYSNDTERAVIRGSLLLKLSGLTANGNNDFGYYGGGSQLSGPSTSTIYRIDYSNDKVDTTPRSAFSAARTYASGFTNAINS